MVIRSTKSCWRRMEKMFTDTFGAICAERERKRNLIKLSATENKIAIETKLSSLNYISFPVRFYDSQHNVISIIRNGAKF